MIQAVAENKYSFNMQVSVKAMAAPDCDRPHQGAAGPKRLFEKAVQSIRRCRDGATLRNRAGGILPATSVNGWA
jgi:hypothetical protein